jgi:hypothetical protein
MDCVPLATEEFPPVEVVLVVPAPAAPTVTASVFPAVSPVRYLIAKAALAPFHCDVPPAPPPTTVTLIAVMPVGMVNVPFAVNTVARPPRNAVACTVESFIVMFVPPTVIAMFFS